MESENIKNFLESDIFQTDLFDSNSVLKILKTKKEMRILYGETYDSHGLTIDSVKYYLCLEYLTRLFKSINPNITATLLIGDTASIINAGVYNKEEILNKISENKSLINELENKYNFTFEIKIMSEITNTKSFKNSYQKVKKYYEKTPDLQEQLKNTILENRLKQEKETNFKYALEEIVIISDYDIKIGPPREVFYDLISQNINNGKPFGVYLKPTYPLGFNYDYFINNSEIEKFGVTPYKAGSNKLQNNRIILNKTTKSEIQQLINYSFVPQYEDLPNPTKDLLNIALLSSAIRKNTQVSESEFNTSKEEIFKIFIDEFHEYFK